MILGLPGQNLGFGEYFVVEHGAVTGGPFVAGETITQPTGGRSASIVSVDAANNRLVCGSGIGTINLSAAITGQTSGASATPTFVGVYGAGRSLIYGDAPFGGYTLPSAQNYDLSDVCMWDVANQIDILFDFGPFGLPAAPDFILLSDIDVTDFNFKTNATNLSSIDVHADADAGFGSPTQIAAQTVNGAPVYGPGVFGQKQIYIPLTGAVERYLRLRLASAGAVRIAIGNIWIGDGFDTDAEGWGLAPGWKLTNIDRSRSIEQEDGGRAKRARPPLRRLSGDFVASQPHFDKILDAVEARQTQFNDDRRHPWALCWDADNRTRAVTGRHYFAGLFEFDGNPEFTASQGKDASGQTVPEIPADFMEWR